MHSETLDPQNQRRGDFKEYVLIYLFTYSSIHLWEGDYWG